MSVSRLLGATMVAGAPGPDENEGHDHAPSPVSGHARGVEERVLIRRVRRLLRSRRTAAAAGAAGASRGRLR